MKQTARTKNPRNHKLRNEISLWASTAKGIDHFLSLFFVVALLALAVSQQAVAAVSFVSGTLYGTEPTVNSLHGLCLNDAKDNPYSSATTFTVSQTGQYTIASTQYGIGADVWFGIYTGAFNTSNPASGRIAQQTRGNWDVDIPVTVNLQAGTTYRLAVSPWCSPDRGVWALAFTGPGQVNSSARINDLDPFIRGNFTGSGQTANMGCGIKEFRESGAQQVDTTGRYYFVDVSYFFGLGVCVGVYTAPFNPSNPTANRILLLSSEYFLSVNLTAGTNYYFVVQPNTLAQTGEYIYLVTPGTDLYIDPVLSGAWFDPASPGQGFFFDIFGHQKQLFLAWFTYDLQRPAGGVQAMMGDPGHRWLTAFGDFDVTSSSLDIEVTSGGVFDQGVAVNQATNGSLDVEFYDCNTGQITYDLGSVGASGVIPIQRVTNFNSRTCQTLMMRAGKPRKLNR